MQAAGDHADCVAYLMGNHVIAERMFRHDPRAMLYAPLRAVIWEDPSGAAWFTVDQPSMQFASSGFPRSRRSAWSSTGNSQRFFRPWTWPCQMPCCHHNPRLVSTLGLSLPRSTGSLAHWLPVRSLSRADA